MSADHSTNAPARDLRKSLRDRRSSPSLGSSLENVLGYPKAPENATQGIKKQHAAPRQTTVPRRQQTTPTLPLSPPPGCFLTSEEVAQRRQGDRTAPQTPLISQAEHDQLKADLDRAATAIAGFKSDRLGDVTDLPSLDAQLRRIRKVFHAVDRELTASRAELESFNATISNLKQEKSEQATASVTITKALQDELASVKAENVKLAQSQKDSQGQASKESQRLRDEIMSLEQDKYFLNEFCMAKQTEVNNLNDDFKAQWESWETQVKALQSANDSLQRTIDRQSEEAAEQSREHQSIIDDLNEEHASLIEHQHQQHSECLDKIDDLEDERAALQEENTKLREEYYASLTTSGDTISGLQQENLALGEINSTLEEHLSQAQFAVESLTIRAEELEETVQHVEQEQDNQAERWQTVLENAEMQNQRLLQELGLMEALLYESKQETKITIENGMKKEAQMSRDMQQAKDGRVRSLVLAFACGVIMCFIALSAFYYYCEEMGEI